MILPARGRILIKKPQTEECLPGGSIIIPEKSREAYAANQFLVVDVGADAECPWPEECSRENHHFVNLKLCVHPIDSRIKSGAWVVVRPRSLVDVGDGMFMVTQDDVLGVFTDGAAAAVQDVQEVRREQIT